ncbi:MAG: DUF502 domain-containing protein [Calditrichaeota bacterium]|nr:DUF502 domain-containing protein [Calditrichota bacterium]
MWKKTKTYFLTGLLALTPIVLTIFIIWKLFFAIDGLLKGFLNKHLLKWLGFEAGQHNLTGLGFITIILFVLLVGFFARNYVGKKILSLSDALVTRIPIINRIYSAIQQISQAFLSEKTEVFKKAVLIEYPRRGIYSIGFFTQDTRGEVQEKLDTDVVSVFLPTTPNPTSGFLLFVPKVDTVELAMPVEEALKLVISGGAIVPNPNHYVKAPLRLTDLFADKIEITPENNAEKDIESRESD